MHRGKGGGMQIPGMFIYHSLGQPELVKAFFKLPTQYAGRLSFNGNEKFRAYIVSKERLLKSVFKQYFKLADIPSFFFPFFNYYFYFTTFLFSYQIGLMMK